MISKQLQVNIRNTGCLLNTSPAGSTVLIFGDRRELVALAQDRLRTCISTIVGYLVGNEVEPCLNLFIDESTSSTARLIILRTVLPLLCPQLYSLVVFISIYFPLGNGSFHKMVD